MSTDIFISCLRQGDYARALDWPNFLILKYSGKKPLSGDDLLTLAIFELINSELSEKDFERIQILYTFLNSFILPAEKAYAGIVIINAALQYYVYLEADLLTFYKNKELVSSEEIEKWMNRDNLILTQHVNNMYLAEKIALLEKKMPAYNKLMDETAEKILLLTHFQQICHQYIKLLSDMPTEQKTIKTGMRMGIAKSLYDYLCQQIVFTPTIKEGMQAYLNKIRVELEPGLTSSWEESYLKKLEDKTMYQRLYEHSVFCLGFFTKNALETVFAFNQEEKNCPKKTK